MNTAGTTPPIVEPVAGQLKHISHGQLVYGVNAGNEIFNRSNERWNKMPGLLACISAADDGTVVGCGPDDKIWRWVNNSWQQLPGLAKNISTGGASHIWCINAQQQIFALQPMNNQWDQKPGAATCLSVGSDGYVVAINAAQDIYAWVNNSWQQLPGKAVDVSVADRNNTYVVNAQGQVFKLNSMTNQWESVQVTANISKVAANTKGVWAIDTNQMIYRQPTITGISVQMGGMNINMGATPQPAMGGMGAQPAMGGMGGMGAPPPQPAMSGGIGNPGGGANINVSLNPFGALGAMFGGGGSQPQAAVSAGSSGFGPGAASGGFGPGAAMGAHVGVAQPAQSAFGGSTTCPKCAGECGWGTFGKCKPGSVHFKNMCRTCNGSGTVNRPLTRCDLCEGQGGLGTFGACEPGSVHYKQDCNRCGGRCYT